MKKSTIVSLIRLYKLEIIYVLAVIIGTIVAMNGLEWIYNQYFADLIKIKITFNIQ